MDNFDFVGHLASTAHAYDATAEIAESFIRLYYRDMHAVEVKWQGYEPDDPESVRMVFAELNAVHARYWLMDTRFAEYWVPAFSSPPAYDITGKSMTTYADMLGNFIAIVAGGYKPEIYLLSVVRDQLKIINRFY
jgi:hypothetical protein